jgi:hypothetical protein
MDVVEHAEGILHLLEQRAQEFTVPGSVGDPRTGICCASSCAAVYMAKSCNNRCAEILCKRAALAVSLSSVSMANMPLSASDSRSMVALFSGGCRTLVVYSASNSAI